MTRGGANSPKPAVKAKQAEAAELAILGYPYAKIAEQLGYSNESSARAAVNAHFKRHSRESFEAMRPILQERAEMLWQSAWRNMNKAEREGQPEAWARAHAAAVRSLEYSARIHGLIDSRTNVQVNVGASSAMESLKAEFNRRLGLGQAIDAEVVSPGT
ncbi:hypothetical protein [Rhodococcus koreensis]